MKRLFVLCLLLSFGCDKGQSNPGQVSASAVAAVSAAPAVAVAPAASAAPQGKTQSYSGNFKAARRASATTKKEGAPRAWEKDDGAKFAGDGQLALTVDADGTVTGTLKGALGERGLRGRLDGDELRAQLVPAGDDMTQIQNGSLALTRDGQGFKGKLTAATGDALVMRQADIVVSGTGS